MAFEPNQSYCVKDCLSEGDKSTIALAFFLAKLDVDANNANKIIVFDDPLSSFDSRRRLYTVFQIRSLLTNIDQLIVLSHNEFFLHEISKNLPRSIEVQTLQISEDFTTSSARIENINLNTLTENKYFKNIRELENFLRTPDILQKDHVLGLLRNVLEAHIRFKFYRQLTQNTGSNTFGCLINELERSTVSFRNDTTPPSILRKLRLINAVSLKPHHGEPEPDYVSLGLNPDTITVGELAYLIQDTFDLVDNRL